MLRRITKQVGRFRAGNEHDYPFSTWNKIAADAGMALDKFSEEVQHNPVLQSSLKRRPVIHRRLGATA